MGLLDELITGIPVIALPLLRDQLQLGYVQIGLLFTVASLSDLLFEPIINLLSDGRAKKPWILCGLVLLAVAFIAMTSTKRYPLLLLAFALSSPASSAAVSLSQIVLIDATVDNNQHSMTMTRWTLFSSIGDFCAPLAVSIFTTYHLDWSQLCWFTTLLCCITAITLAPLPFPVHIEAEKDENLQPEKAATSTWVSFRAAFHDPLLLRWSALTIIPTMLDEVFLSYMVLYLHDRLHINAAVIGLIVALQMLASFSALLLLERLLKHHQPSQHSSIRLLAWLSIITLAGVVILLLSHTLWLVTLSLIVISASCAGWYPLAKAEAYAQKPGHAGIVNGIISLCAPFELVLPTIIGLISANFGSSSGLAVLGTAPILMLLILPYQHNQKT
jgi:MFS family permease